MKNDNTHIIAELDYIIKKAKANEGCMVHGSHGWSVCHRPMLDVDSGFTEDKTCWTELYRNKELILRIDFKADRLWVSYSATQKDVPYMNQFTRAYSYGSPFKYDSKNFEVTINKEMRNDKTSFTGW